MKRPLINAPSLGSIQAKGYWITLLVLMFGGVMIFLHYVFFVTMAVPVVGAFHREPKAIWRLFSISTLVVAVAYLGFQFLQRGNEGLVFFYASDPFGFSFPQINLLSFLTVSLIFLPLSAVCAIDRIRHNKKRTEQDVPPNA